MIESYIHRLIWRVEQIITFRSVLRLTCFSYIFRCHRAGGGGGWGAAAGPGPACLGPAAAAQPGHAGPLPRGQGRPELHHMYAPSDPLPSQLPFSESLPWMAHGWHNMLSYPFRHYNLAGYPRLHDPSNPITAPLTFPLPPLEPQGRPSRTCPGWTVRAAMPTPSRSSCASPCATAGSPHACPPCS